MSAFVVRVLKIAKTSMTDAWVTFATSGVSPAAAALDLIFKEKTIEIKVGTSSG